MDVVHGTSSRIVSCCSDTAHSGLPAAVPDSTSGHLVRLHHLLRHLDDYLVEYPHRSIPPTVLSSAHERGQENNQEQLYLQPDVNGAALPELLIDRALHLNNLLRLEHPA